MNGTTGQGKEFRLGYSLFSRYEVHSIEMGKTRERRDLCLGWEFQILYNSREFIGAGNRIRTGDPDLGKVVLYQLSYSRSLMYGCLFSGQRSQRSMLRSAIVVNNPWIRLKG